MGENITTQSPVLQHEFSDGFLIGAIILRSVAALAGVIGNVCVMTYMLLRRKKTPTSYLIVNLAVTDVFTCVTMFPSSIYKFVRILETGGDDTQWLCKLTNPISILVVSVSVLTLTAITFDRYLYIARPLRYEHIMSKTRTILLIFAIWLLTLGYTPLVVILYKQSPDTSAAYIGYCATLKASLSLIHRIVYYLIPIIAIVILNYKMFRVAQSHRRRINSMTTSTQDVTRKNLAKELKVIKTFIIVVGVLVGCFTPYNLVIIATMYHIQVPSNVLQLSFDLLIVNSVLNPFIYAFRQIEHRNGFRRILTALYTCHYHNV